MVMETKQKGNKQYELEKGLQAFSKYIGKCKAENKKPTTLQNFFSRYDPETLEPALGTPPLKKYVQRYHGELKKLEAKCK